MNNQIKLAINGQKETCRQYESARYFLDKSIAANDKVMKQWYELEAILHQRISYKIYHKMVF